MGILRRNFSPVQPSMEPLTVSGPSSGASLAAPWRLRICAYGVCSRIIGLVLCAAAIGKAHQLATEPVLETDLFTSRTFLGVFCLVEFALSLLMLVGLAPKTTRVLALLWLSGLAGVSVARVAGSQSAVDSACGCFGKWPVTTAQALSFTLVALAVLALCIPSYAPRVSRAALILRLAVYAGIVFPVGIYGGAAIARFQPAELAGDGTIIGSGKHVVIRPEKWIGTPCPLLKHIAIGAALHRGEWRIVLIRVGCERCEEIVSDSVRDRRDDFAQGHTRTAFVELPTSDSDTSASERDTDRDDRFSFVGFGPRFGKLSDAFQWYVATPTEIVIRNGTVMEVRKL